MNIKKQLSQNSLILLFRLIKEFFYEILVFSKELGTANRYKIPSKFKSDLTIKFHAIEKGLSIGDARPGFGQDKIVTALKDLLVFYNKFKDADFVFLNLNLVDKYLDFNKKNNIETPQIESLRNSLFDVVKDKQPISETDAGIIIMKKNEVLTLRESDFPKFSASRFSIRDFDKKLRVNKQDIYEALSIAQKAPSACNRQPWHVHLFSGDIKNQLLEFHGGCKGFSKDIEYAILITSDLNAYFIHEINQPYVDGGLYGMNLLYALHCKGLATIPLTTGFKQKERKTLKEKFSIPSNETPIMIIGIGEFKEEYKVAVSHRISYNHYLKEHE